MAYSATAFFGSGVTGLVEGNCTLVFYPKSTGTGVTIDGANWSMVEMAGGFYGITVATGVTESGMFRVYVTATPATEAWGSIGDEITVNTAVEAVPAAVWTEDLDGATAGAWLQQAAAAGAAAMVSAAGWDFTVQESVTAEFSGALADSSYIKVYAKRPLAPTSTLLLSFEAGGATISHNGVVPALSTLAVEVSASGSDITGGVLTIDVPRTRGTTPVLLTIPDVLDGETQEYLVGADGSLMEKDAGRVDPTQGTDITPILAAISALETEPQSTLILWSERSTKSFVAMTDVGIYPVVVVVENVTGYVRDDLDGGLFKNPISVAQGWIDLVEDTNLPGTYWKSVSDEDWRDGIYTAYLYKSEDLTGRPVASYSFMVYSNILQVISGAMMRKLRNIEVRV